MSKVFLIGDTHFYHKNIVKFNCPETGLKLRPWDNVEDMNKTIIENWNTVVSDDDVVYHLGDVLLGDKSNLSILDTLRGRKRLIMGNHDTAPVAMYLRFFEKVMSSKTLSGVILTHIPIRPDYLNRYKANIHGHVHSCSIKDNFYFNVSVEAINYTPISLEYVLSAVNEKRS